MIIMHGFMNQKRQAQLKIKSYRSIRWYNRYNNKKKREMKVDAIGVIRYMHLN